MTWGPPVHISQWMKAPDRGAALNSSLAKTCVEYVHLAPQKKAGKGKVFKKAGLGQAGGRMFHHPAGRKQVRAGLCLPALLPLANALRSHCIVLTGQSLLSSAVRTGPQGTSRLSGVESDVSGLASLPHPWFPI